MSKRKAPYQHADGSNCWTKNCSLGNRSANADKEKFIKEMLEKNATKQATSLTPAQAEVKPAMIDLIAPKEAFDQAVRDRRLSGQRHPEYPYIIYKYSQQTTYMKDWDEVTLASRGLVVNEETGEIVARCFPKFFNYSEGMNTPEDLDGPFLVAEKLDGCFPSEARLNLWNGGTITIGEVVKGKLTPVLVGMNSEGALVPTKPINWFNNGRKKKWLNLYLDSKTSRLSGGGKKGGARMQLTPNHHIYLNGEYLPAIEAKVGDVMIGQDLSITDNLVHMIKSSLLGDGCIVLTKTTGKCKYQESHSEKQEDYVRYLREIMGDSSANRTDTTSGYGSRLVWVGSKEYTILETLREEWYPEGKKVVPSDLSWMDDFSVAKWYMDDGSLSHSEKQVDRAVFSTNGFSEQEVERLAHKLEEMYGVSTTVYNSEGKGWSLRVNKGKEETIDNMWKAITSHIIPSLRYKVPAKFRNIPFTPYEQGKELRVTKEVRIVAIEEKVSERKNPVGWAAYDIGTETENYMVNGVIVHNSLGILYQNPAGEYEITTAGGFQSDQAAHATKLYQEKYAGKWNPNPNLTYHFEIIYDNNRIVVDYKGEDDIYLLGAVNKHTGVSVPLTEVTEWKGKKAKTYDNFTSLTDVVNAPDPGIEHEGYVVHFTKTDKRVKIKFDEYLKVHRIATGLNKRRIHELMSTGGMTSLEEFKVNAPEEFKDYIETMQREVQTEYDTKVNTIKSTYDSLVKTLPADVDQKTFALKVQQEVPRELASHMFTLRAKGDVNTKSVWQSIEPPFEKGFWATGNGADE